MLPESMKISKLLSFKERNNFAQKKTRCPLKQNPNIFLWVAACVSLSTTGSTSQGLLGQLFTNIYICRHVSRYLMRFLKVLQFLGANPPGTSEHSSPQKETAHHFGNELIITKPFFPWDKSVCTSVLCALQTVYSTPKLQNPRFVKRVLNVVLSSLIHFQEVRKNISGTDAE